jgi:hypothetical protein
MIIKQLLTIFLAFLMAVPSWASSAAVGTVQGGEAATVHGLSMVPGTTLFDGDTIAVGPRGSALIAFLGGAQLVLAADSEVELLKEADTQPIQVDVSQGLARFRSTEKTPVEALLYDATVRPAKGGDGVGFIRILSPTSALIGSEKGEMLVTTAHDGNSMTIPEGMATTVGLAPEKGEGRRFGRRRHGALVILMGALIVGTVAGVATAINLNEPHTQPSISPFKPK